MPTPPKSSYRKVSVQCSRNFKVHSRFRGIAKPDRLSYLKLMAKGELEVTYDRLRQMRAGFDQHKIDTFPMNTNCRCYCCGDEARIRHHVIPLGRGGRNTRNNIVPLCDPCHLKIHPDMERKARVKKEPLTCALAKPKVAIVAIPPK